MSHKQDLIYHIIAYRYSRGEVTLANATATRAALGRMRVAELEQVLRDEKAKVHGGAR